MIVAPLETWWRSFPSGPRISSAPFFASPRIARTAKPRVSILHPFASLPGPRLDRTRRQQLPDSIVLAIGAVVCSADPWEDAETFGRAKRAGLPTFRQPPQGIPSPDTFHRAFARWDPEAFQRRFVRGIQARSAATGTPTRALGGKTLRRPLGRAPGKGAWHRVSAGATAQHLPRGQAAGEAHSPASPAPPKLRDLLGLAGALVPLDALGCPEIAAPIREGGGD